MPPLYKLKFTLRSLALLGLLLSLSTGLYAQQTEALQLQQQIEKKLAPHLHQTTTNNPAVSLPTALRVQVKNKADFYTWLQQQQLDLAVQEIAGQERTFLVSGLTTKQLSLLLAAPAVLYVDKPNRKATEELELKDTDFVANNIYAAQGRYPNLTGEGMGVSVKENPFNPGDLDLKGRILSPEKFGSSYSAHATTMATIIAGAGNSSPAGKGVTWKSKIAFSDFAALYPDNSNALLSQGITVQNHSYGVGIENYYGLESQAYDRQSYQHPQVLHVFSSGNSGNGAETTGKYAGVPGFANLTGQFKTSKNTLSVGALEPDGHVGVRSSKGPAYDGRIKPELVAHGTGGTSEAAAVVSGIALLVQQAYKKEQGSLPPASLVKAAMLNSAEDVGRPGPDFESGFGNADAVGAIRSIAEQRFVIGSVAQGESKSYQLQVPAGTYLLKATIVWHDPEAEPNAAHALINDLDLTLHHSATGHTWQPWVLRTFPHQDSLRLPAKRGVDRINNVEQITVSTPTAGSYTLTVTGHQVTAGLQEFSLVFAYERSAEWLYPTAGATLVAGQPNRISWKSTSPSGTGRLEYRLADSDQWQTITDNLDLSDKSYTWQPPATAALAQLRIMNGSTLLLSDEFILAQQLQLLVGFNCEEKVMVHWRKQPNVAHYQLSIMGATHLEPFLTTADTLALLDKTALQYGIIAIAPLVQGIRAQNSRSIPIDNTASGCYITSFLPRQLVMETVELDLEISTLYQVASLTLERLQNNEFKPVTTLSPVTQFRHLLTDYSPDNGRNVYRAKVMTTDGKSFYSQQEEVIYAREDFMQVYPNPVVAGRPFFVAVGNDSAQIQLYDQMGRLVLETTGMGVLKEVQTHGLPGGLYIIRLRTEAGIRLSGKILLL
jgi:hypothetical protein